jgi:transcriptional regulator with XRE-family HTH domain
MTTGERITNYLMKQEPDLKKIAIKAGIPYQSLFQMKQNNQYKTSAIDKLAQALNISVAELIGEEPEKVLDRKAEELKKEFPKFVDKIMKK